MYPVIFKIPFLNIPIYGYIYDVKSGRLIEVENATSAGRAVGLELLNDG